jgi:hypothetical protein
MKLWQKPGKNTSLLGNVLLAVYTLFAFFVVLSTIYFIFLSCHAGPFRDMWIAMDFVRAYFEGRSTLADLFSLHGGAHRLVIPRLLFLIEYGVFAGTNIFLIITSIIIQLSVVYLVWRALKQETHITASWRWFVTAMTLLLMFNATQLENFIYTFDTQWFLTSAAAAWALYFWNQLFKDFSEQRTASVKMFVSALLLTVVAMFSSFSGLCIWLVLPLLMASYRVSGKQIATAVFAVILVVVAYMQGTFSEATNWHSGPPSITPAVYVTFVFSMLELWLKWTALYFGSPLGREYFWFGALFSYASLLYLAWHWIKLLTMGAKSFTSFQVFCLSIALFAAMVGMSTGLGRMYFVNTADEDRYQSIVLIYWLGVFAFSLSRALQREVQQHMADYKYASIAVIIFWTGLVIPIASIRDARAQINFFDRVNNTNLAIATGQWAYDQIKDTLILGDKWKKLNRPEKHAAFLHEQKWGVFASPEFALLGSRLEQRFISADQCEGRVDAIVALPSPYRGYRISGQGQAVQGEFLPTVYMAIDETGRVVGLGRLQRQKDSFWPRTWQPPGQAHWLLYTQNLDLAPSIQILARLSEGGYCKMTSAKLPSPAA